MPPIRGTYDPSLSYPAIHISSVSSGGEGTRDVLAVFVGAETLPVLPEGLQAEKYNLLVQLCGLAFEPDITG